MGHSRIKSIIVYSGVFLGTLSVLLIFLLLSSKVGKESIQEKFEESASYLCEDIVFPYMEEGIKPSCIDRYADSILLNIAYNFESGKSLESVMWASYYFTLVQNENNNLSDAVLKGKEKNKQYLRYWHGSAAVVRLLHTFLNIKGIYIFHAFLIAALLGVLLYLLIRHGYMAEAVIVMLSLIIVSIWYVPFSLEYTWAFLCMFCTSIAAVMLALRGREKYLGIVFLVAGMVTNYLDFLTTETLTFTVPLILVLSLQRKKAYGSFKQGVIFIAKNTVIWGIGYIGMWVSKWLIASVVLGENVMPYITEHIEERVGGDIGAASFIEYLWLAVYRNVACLFPMDYGVGGVIIAAIVLLVIIYFCYVHRKKKMVWNYILLMSVLGLVPIVRFLILRNHSALHHFFTFRAMMATVMAFLLSAWSMIEIRRKGR